jgi:hypothetical protein
VSDDVAVWRRLTAVYKAEAFCGIFLDMFNEGISVSPATLLALGAGGVILGLDIYGSAQAEGAAESPNEPLTRIEKPFLDAADRT